MAAEQDLRHLGIAETKRRETLPAAAGAAEEQRSEMDGVARAALPFSERLVNDPVCRNHHLLAHPKRKAASLARRTFTARLASLSPKSPLVARPAVPALHGVHP